jgi:VRR-NUC domain
MKIKLSERGVYEPVLTEEHVIRQITEGLSICGVRVYRIVERIPRRNAYREIRGRTSTPGIPDLYCRMGLLNFWIEAKRPGGVVRESQKRFIAEALEDGCIAFVARSWDDVVQNLLAFGVQLRMSPLGRIQKS